MCYKKNFILNQVYWEPGGVGHRLLKPFVLGLDVMLALASMIP